LAVGAWLLAHPAALVAEVPQSSPANDPTPFSEIELVSTVSSVQPGTPFTLAVHITLDPGWHTYWTNGGDAGDELVVSWSVPDGFEVGPLQWPVPHLLPAPPLMSYGYEGQVFVLVEVVPPADLRPGQSVEIVGDADYQVCADVCLIALTPIAMTLPVRATAPLPDENWATALADLGSRLPARADGWQVRAWTVPDEDAPAYVLEITGGGSGGLPEPGSLPAPHLFADGEFVIEHALPQRVVRDGTSLRMWVPRNYFESEFRDRLSGLIVADVDSEIPTAWHVEARVSEPPADADVIVAALQSDDAVRTGGVPEGMAPLSRPAPPTLAGSAGAGASVGIWTALLFGFVGGLILNLMPCVFPVLSVKVLSFVEGSAGGASARRHGFAFAGGVFASVWALAGVLMAIRAGGENLGWGFQLQSPLFVGLLAALLFALALNLSGLFEVGLGLTRLGKVGGSTDLRDSFVLGGLTVVVATPCTAPFMGAALGFALVQPATVGLGVFTALAAGLAAPYVILSSMPGLLARLPRPGPWMETLKQALAFPMYATVVWLVWVFGNQAGGDASALLLLALMGVGLAGWIYGRFGGTTPSLAVRTATFIAVLGAGAAFVQGMRSADPPAGISAAATALGWEPYSVERVAALRDQGRPIFIDFTADWCLSCKVNERIALNTDEVRTAFAEADMALLVADWTSRDPDIAESIAGFGRSGIPLYVIYPVGSGPAEILPAVLTPGIVVEAVRKAVGD